jgi:hypothetical protein
MTLNVKILITTLYCLTSFHSFAVIADQPIEELAQEIAHCYVAHEREQTHVFTSGEAEKMKVLINDLVGKESGDQKILIANKARDLAQDKVGIPVVISSIKKYCKSLDKRLASYNKSQ